MVSQEDPSLKQKFLDELAKLNELIKGPTSPLIRYLKSNNLSEFTRAEFTEAKGEALASILKNKHIIDPQTIRDYFTRMPKFIDRQNGKTPCHILGQYSYWPDVWKPKFVQLYLNDNIDAIDVKDKQNRSIIECFKSSKVQLYIVRSICLRKISHYMW
eukprot:CAMPEP_0204915314 /NCGR_PEP_ID=MMETSP1397-20131031/13338_1 /ASSEMBLY_ACC=CAM_ASM_000891 /TAXON_ID=49980 /ORGANISM="Climacostomum Climacostomum virens, Strain Stock W-24" /LENGTH=157 /DNA_ID=CAMNT_0052087295 /DNA_START=127 /DNA_END=597 /DNA_ORIENTATION=+